MSSTTLFLWEHPTPFLPHRPASPKRKGSPDTCNRGREGQSSPLYPSPRTPFMGLFRAPKQPSLSSSLSWNISGERQQPAEALSSCFFCPKPFLVSLSPALTNVFSFSKMSSTKSNENNYIIMLIDTQKSYLTKFLSHI